MHISIRMDPAFTHRRAGAGSPDGFFRSERGVVRFGPLGKASGRALPRGMKAEGLTITFAGEERGARLFLRGTDGVMRMVAYGRCGDGTPSRWAFSTCGKSTALTRGAVESLLNSPDARTRQTVQQLLAWVDGSRS